MSVPSHQTIEALALVDELVALTDRRSRLPHMADPARVVAQWERAAPR